MGLGFLDGSGLAVWLGLHVEEGLGGWRAWGGVWARFSGLGTKGGSSCREERRSIRFLPFREIISDLFHIHGRVLVLNEAEYLLVKSIVFSFTCIFLCLYDLNQNNVVSNFACHMTWQVRFGQIWAKINFMLRNFCQIANFYVEKTLCLWYGYGLASLQCYGSI